MTPVGGRGFTVKCTGPSALVRGDNETVPYAGELPRTGPTVVRMVVRNPAESCRTTPRIAADNGVAQHAEALGPDLDSVGRVQ